MESKFWNYSLMFLAVGFFAYAGFRIIKPRNPNVQSLGLLADYSMPRPDSYSGDFSIQDREVNRRYEKNSLPGQPVGELAVKPAGKVKAEDAKKEKLEQEKKKLAAQEAAKKAKKFSVDKINSSLSQDEGFSADAIGNQNSVPENYYANNTNNQDVNNRTPTSPKSEEAVEPVEEQTAQDWVRQIRSNPTPEAAAQLVAALQSAKISEKEYNEISRELVSDKDPRIQEVGLILLDSNPSVASFRILVESESLVTGDLLTKQKAILLKYGTITRSLALAQTMVVPELTEKSLGLAELAVKNEQARRSAVDPRAQRGQGRTPAQDTHLQTLTMGLTTLVGSGSAYAARAQELMRAITELQKS